MSRGCIRHPIQIFFEIIDILKDLALCKNKGLCQKFSNEAILFKTLVTMLQPKVCMWRFWENYVLQKISEQWGIFFFLRFFLEV